MSTKLPAVYRRWHLYGAGLESVGRGGRPESVAMPEPGDGEILVRHDACGICFSDIKIINLGPNHPRLQGRDLAHEPVVMGHEVALTVEKVGPGVDSAIAPGNRYIVQADVYYKGRNLAYGYALPGGMSQYGLVGPEVLAGDEGNYLLPIRPETGAVEAALVEPWACVEAAYRWKLAPASVTLGSTTTADEFEAAAGSLGKGATLRLDKSQPFPRPVSVDIGRIHYDNLGFVGPGENDRNELKAGGAAWFVGTAGPMGMMHLQRALSLPNPPRLLVGTDRHDARLDAVRERFAALAASRGVDLRLYNVRTNPLPDLHEIAPEGFDDIVVMVPSIPAIEEAFPFLATDGVLNVFAGVARGTMATLPMADVAVKNVRIIGTSGSSIADMVAVRDKMESGTLDTAASLAAIGGLDAFKEGLDAVQNSRFPGKTVIFPHLENLPLTALPDLKDVRPDVHAKLRDGKYWTHEAEAALLLPRPNDLTT